MTEIDEIKKIVHELKDKVLDLEAQLKAKAGLAPAVNVPKSIRMVLIGPPGAGMY